MTYKESLDFLFSQLPMFSRVGAAAYKPGLDTSIALDNFFGNPHRKFKSIHIGGTNGKGSTSHMLASILQEQGYKVGLYTSPHLADFRERIRVNGEKIPEAAVIDFVERWQKCDYEGHPSFFELTMMMAFDWFARAEVDYAIIEVGMGGRLDSTNIITPIATVVTNISRDHMQFLGDTVEKIAAEKAGIFKPGVPAVIGSAEGRVREVFAGHAADTGAPILFACDQPKLIKHHLLDDGTISGDSVISGEFISPLGGEYQLENINTVLHTVDVLRATGLTIDSRSIHDGLENVVANTGLMGRWKVTARNPLTICDTGHNEAGLRYTMGQLCNLYKRRKVNSTADCSLRMVIGFVNDKDVEHIIPLLPKFATYYVTNASVPRAMPANDLAALFARHDLSFKVYPDGVESAYLAARAEAGEQDIIYVGGSTFIVADYLTMSL